MLLKVASSDEGIRYNPKINVFTQEESFTRPCSFQPKYRPVVGSIPCNLLERKYLILRREKILQDSAQEAEFAALSLSSTSNGYNILIRRTARAVSHLANPEQGQDEDVLSDAQDLMDIIRRHCKVWQNKAIQGV